ncbi:MAG TPA: endonuclease domain-containing protein [Caulobacteraceae bacterium]|jgi:adenine-specific DNA-methyltransferase|nr:endonuclease domain-containing protein [Caulobacteraceae bacterium]
MEREAKFERARSLRAQATDVERKLWAVLRARRLGGFKFRRQLPIDRFIADFACAEARLIVELDGGQHVDNADYDEARTRVLEACGWRLIRFWNTDVIDDLDGVARDILAELELPAA